MQYGHRYEGHDQQPAHGYYPPDNLYSRDPYAPQPSPGAPDPSSSSYFAPHHQYSSSDFVSPGRDGDGIPGGRQTYPPQASDADLDKYAGAFGAAEKQVPVTRGSIAAQLAAEGSIPKKEGLRMFRKDEHAGALTRGGRARCCGRVFCCTLILVILILVGIVAAFFLWVKPPDVGFEGIGSGTQVSLVDSGFNLNVTLKINVINPNFFGADFDKIEATGYYPTKPNDKIGGGEMKNVEIKKYSNTTLRFPFAINYTTSYDSDLSVLTDIATRCGFIGSSKSQLTVNYRVKTKVKVIAVTISPSFSSSASFDCPLSESDITGFLGGSLDSLLNGGLSAITGGSRLHRRDADDEDEVRLRVARATRFALAKLFERGAEEVVETFGAAGRRYRIGTMVPPPPALLRD
ncbi:hypothetical protein Rhopal_001456-T1 [Rhodotorula paludigena]|uniref:Late embryogenesis abundant protein LEA-2 subgroup domain-containing protein n=1 Tax=Rhodotorula paludigena TaxID=86838 RepID=A0AAV5G7L4_9BASI|nr:hypothetical protein Rhopal_001456-T1 [Rhodotorula paludigena]